jgi:thiamine-phosphate diphosphorylase
MRVSGCGVVGSRSVTGSPDPGEFPRLHLVTDDQVLQHPAFLSVAAELLSAYGGKLALHLRGPGLSGRVVWELASACAEVARESGAWLIVNDRVDVAMGCGASGAQLGQASIGVARARTLLGPGPAIGASIHSADEARHAVREGADFLVAGTLFRTETHPGLPPSGVAWLGELTGFQVPVIGIGGISPERVPQVLNAGAHGVAVIRGVWQVGDPGEAVRDYLAYME